MSDEKKAPLNKPSGEHPAVKSFRAKMESISDGETMKNLVDLDASLAKYLKETNSEPPPSAEKDLCEHGELPTECETCKT